MALPVMAVTGAARFGMAAGKALLSPAGLTVLSIISIVLLGFNPLYLLIDLIIKSINILSGNALINSILNNTFEPSSPIFVIYITVFIISFIILFFKLIKNGLSDVAFSSEIKDGKQKVQTMSFSKLKWVLIWLLAWIGIPWVFMIIIWIVNLFANMLGLDTWIINGIGIYSADDLISSVGKISSSLNSQLDSLKEFKNIFFPNDISTAVVPDFIKNQNTEITDEIWRNFLSELSTNSDAIKYRDGLNTAISKYNSILNNKLFVSGIAEINSWTKSNTKEIINSLRNNINDLINFISTNENLPINLLDISIVSTLEKIGVESPLMAGKDILLNKNFDFYQKINMYGTQIKQVWDTSSLSGIAIYGIEGQLETNENASNIGFVWKGEELTNQLATALYGYAVMSPWMTLGNQIGGSSFIPIGINIQLISNIFSMLSNPIQLFEVIISTVGFAFCVTAFSSILMMLAGKLFDYISMIMIAPFAIGNGIADNGEKATVWMKTVFGKILVIFLISFSISIFVIVISLTNKFFGAGNIMNIISGTSIDSKIGVYLLSKFLIVIVIIASSSGMLEFIGWSATILSFDQKLQKTQNSFTRRESGAADKLWNAHESNLRDGSYRHKQLPKGGSKSIGGNSSKTSARGK